MPEAKKNSKGLIVNRIKILKLVAKALNIQNIYDEHHPYDYIEFNVSIGEFEPIGYDSWDNLITGDIPTYNDTLEDVEEPFDFSSTSTAPKVKKLLGCSLGNYLDNHPFILDKMNLRTYDPSFASSDSLQTIDWQSDSIELVANNQQDGMIDVIDEEIQLDHNDVLQGVQKLLKKLSKKLR